MAFLDNANTDSKTNVFQRSGAPVSAGYYKRRRGILDHIDSGAVDLARNRNP